MALQVRADVAERRELVFREITFFCEHGVKAGRCMAFGKHEAVAIRLLRVLGIDVHFFKIKIREDVGGGQRAAGMAGFRCVRAADHALPDMVRTKFQFVVCHDARSFHAIRTAFEVASP